MEMALCSSPGSLLFRTHASHRFWLFFSPFSLAQPFTVPGCTVRVPWKAQFRVVLPPRVLMEVSHTTCGILQWSCYFTCRLSVPSNPLWTKLTRQESHFLVILLLICSVTRKVLTIPHDTLSGTIARCESPLKYDTITTPVTSTS